MVKAENRQEHSLTGITPLRAHKQTPSFTPCRESDVGPPGSPWTGLRACHEKVCSGDREATIRRKGSGGGTGVHGERCLCCSISTPHGQNSRFIIGGDLMVRSKLDILKFEV